MYESVSVCLFWVCMCMCVCLYVYVGLFCKMRIELSYWWAESFWFLMNCLISLLIYQILKMYSRSLWCYMFTFFSKLVSYQRYRLSTSKYTSSFICSFVCVSVYLFVYSFVCLFLFVCAMIVDLDVNKAWVWYHVFLDPRWKIESDITCS